MKIIFTTFLTAAILVGCKKDPIKIKFTGKILEGPYVTPSSQCGTHVIEDGLNMFVLRSEDIDLNLYVNDTVTVYGQIGNCETTGYISVENVNQ
ncbi:MAG: hypothetical protein K9G41_12010 [Flavobacteriales bacterium]|nr:hypothetical protein [Flavobacteriales bacterium]